MERTMCEEFLPREVFDAEQKGVERELVNLRTTIDRYMVKQDTTNAELFKKIDHLANVVLNGVKK
jgi:glutamine synthetase type III